MALGRSKREKKEGRGEREREANIASVNITERKVEGRRDKAPQCGAVDTTPTLTTTTTTTMPASQELLLLLLLYAAKDDDVHDIYR